MMRPKSAKPGARASDNDDDQEESRDSRDQVGIREQIKTESQKNKNRMLSATHQRRFMNIAKPVQVATGEFTRIMPKHIYQDKERLYSEALQLKRTDSQYVENMHGIIDENMKLKTKIAVLEREKQKLSRACDQEMTGKMYVSGNNNHDNGMVTKLKKMLREAQEQARTLQTEGKKLKKTVKYTKISELEIENKSLIEESIRLNRIVEELMERQEQDADQQNRLDQLETFLKAKMEENEGLINTNKRITEEVLILEQNLKSSQAKSAERDKKLQKDLDIAKRRLADSKRENEYLNGQIIKIREEKSKQQQIPQSSNIAIRPKNVEPAIAVNNNKSAKTINELEVLKKRNAQLQAKVEQLLKNQQSRLQYNQIKDKQRNQSSQNKDKQSKDQNNLKNKVPEFKEASAAPQQKSNKYEPIQKVDEPNLNKSQLEQLEPQDIPKPPVQSHKEKQIQHRNSYEDEQFEFQPQQKDEHIESSAQPDNIPTTQKNTPPKNSKPTTDQPSVKYEQYKEDFAAEDDQKNDQQILYKKEEKKPATSAKKKKGTTKPKSSSNKKQLTQLSELLTYRMKAQRYPFGELQQDILDSEQSEFRVNELSSMLQNSPFFLTEQQVTKTLQYFFDNSEKLDESIALPSAKLIQKLRKLIKNFELMEEEEQQSMDMRIAQMVTTYANELQAAFEQKRNGPDTISKTELQDLFKQLELQSTYIELIIGRLSLVSDDLNHLNYYEFFRQFYEGDDLDVQEVDEEYEHTNSRTLNRNNMIQEEQVEESEESKRSKKHTDKRKAGRKPAYNIQ